MFFECLIERESFPEADWNFQQHQEGNFQEGCQGWREDQSQEILKEDWSR
jgi:hypothetical protein|tara:strand:+ start:337 stop:486 length:150 start_codon:yes stop_codon:yes gene_type:complete